MRSLIEWADGQTTYLDGMTVVDATGSDGLADWEFVVAVPVGGLIEHQGRLGKVLEHEGEI